jgi:hypothetical protein
MTQYYNLNIKVNYVDGNHKRIDYEEPPLFQGSLEDEIIKVLKTEKDASSFTFKVTLVK